MGKYVIFIIQNLQEKVPVKFSSFQTKKRSRHQYKKWWNSHLDILFKELCESEKKFLSIKGNIRDKDAKRATYKSKQKGFDREVKKAKSKYERDKQIEL